MVGEGDMKVEVMSKKLYYDLFYEFCEQIDIHKIRLVRMIPLLKYIVNTLIKANNNNNNDAQAED